MGPVSVVLWPTLIVKHHLLGKIEVSLLDSIVSAKCRRAFHFKWNFQHPYSCGSVATDTADSEMATQTERRAKQPSPLVCHRVSKDLKWWGAWDTTSRHKVKLCHTIVRLEGRGVERGSARQTALKGRARPIVNPTNIGTVSVSKATVENNWWVVRIWEFQKA